MVNQVNTRIRVFLKEKNVSLNLLADYLDYSVDEMESALNDESVEMRLVEQISKNLQIPLYSFFSSPGENKIYTYKPKKDNSEIRSLKMRLDAANSEIESLKNKLSKKELLIQQLEREIASK